MAHFSEMEFLFRNTPNIKTLATTKIDNIVGKNEKSIYSNDGDTTYYVYKGPWGSGVRKKGYDNLGFPNERLAGNHGTQSVKNYTKTTVYKNRNSSNNPYEDLIKNFDGQNSSKSLIIKASDLAYLRELGVYPINRMAVLRRFQDGQLVPEKLDELDSTPISTVVGWLKEDENFGNFSFNENWTTTNKRLDELLGDMIKENFSKNSPIKSIMPVPGFARGILFGLLKKAGVVGGSDSPWDWNDIPIGDPNVLQEGPYRDPTNQNIASNIQYTFETTYEQKFIGDVDPGTAMIDIIDNLLKMGTSDMKFWLNNDSTIIKTAKEKAQANDINFWWIAVKNIVLEIGTFIIDTMKSAKNAIKTMTTQEISKAGKEFLDNALQSIMSATIAKYRWELKGSFEMMTGRDSTTPWYLTIGNPYSPWLATNHIIVNKINIETSNELGFNDMPIWLKVKVDCGQSRNLGRNEIIRMFNNSFLREYSKIDKPTMDSELDQKQNQPLDDVNKGGTGSSDQEKATNKNKKSDAAEFKTFNNL